MFTGIVEEIGFIEKLTKTKSGLRFVIEAKVIMDSMEIGDSVSVNGVCLTVSKIKQNYFYVDLVEETIKKTNLGSLKKGSNVNLERAITLATRLGGHILQGHIETIGTIVGKKVNNDSAILSINIETEFLKYCLPKGSIAIDGISLTIATISDNIISIALIPHTLKKTTLGSKKNGDLVNIETDIIGKYVERLMSFNDGDLVGNELLFMNIKNWEFGES